MKYLFIVLFTTSFIYGAVNDTTIDSAVNKRIYLGNYNYNTVIASAPILSLRWASDINRPVFKNRYGTAYKVLTDASTSSNTQATRLFFADANGAASSSANLTFAIDKLNITGKLTTSDSITGGNGKFTGRITGTDFKASDSITGVSGRLSTLILDSLTISNGLKVGSGSSGQTSSPKNIDCGLTFSDGVTKDKLKLYLYNSGGNKYGFGVGSNADQQYHTGSSSSTHDFYINDTLTNRIYKYGVTSVGRYKNSKTIDSSSYFSQMKNDGGTSDVIYIEDNRGYNGITTGSILNITGYRGPSQSYTESSSALKVQSYDGAYYPILDANVWSRNVGVRKSTPQYPLDVNGQINTNDRITSTDLQVSDSVVGIKGVFSDSVKTMHLKARFSAKVDSGGYYTGSEALNHQWWVGGQAVAYNGGPNQFWIDGPGGSNNAAFRIDSGSIDSTLVISHDTVKVMNLMCGRYQGQPGTIDADTIKSSKAIINDIVSKKQAVLNTLDTFDFTSGQSYTINVDTLSTNNCEWRIPGGGNSVITLTGTIGTVIYVRVTTGGSFTVTNSGLFGNCDIQAGQYKQYIIAEDGKLLKFNGD